jgi:hypothetical protein
LTDARHGDRQPHSRQSAPPLATIKSHNAQNAPKTPSRAQVS